jgi:serine/threonine protein kinase
MRPDNPRWVEVTPSRFAHERQGLEAIRNRLPDHEPFWAWSNFEIVTDRGRALEVDLMVLAPTGLFIVELKHWRGAITGDRYRWQIRNGRRVRTTDNPWLLANAKAREIRTVLVDRLGRLQHAPPDPGSVLPRIEAVIYLHHPDTRSNLAEVERPHVYGVDGSSVTSGLPELVAGLLDQPADPASAVRPSRARAIAELVNQAGFARRRRRRIGGYELLPDVVSEGEGYQDFLAEHATFTDEVVRIRVWHTGLATTTEERGALERAAQREYRLLRHLQYPGIINPISYHDGDLGPSLIYRHDPDAQRLDHVVASEPLALDAQLAIIRGLAETLQFAHGRKISHRGLSPRSVYLVRGEEQTHRAAISVQVSDWQTGALRSSASGSSDPNRSLVRGTGNIDLLLNQTEKAYAAPETFNSSGDAVDDVRADVFGLGAIAYHVLTGNPPASNAIELRQRVAGDQGLDLAVHLDSPPEPLRQLVLHATRGVVSNRLATVEAFLDELALAENELRRQAEADLIDPLDAAQGTVFNDRWKLVRRLGSGSTAVGLLVRDLDTPGAREGDREGRLVVLKVAKDTERASRLLEEADVLRAIEDPRVARLIAEPFPLGNRTAIAIEHAGEKTLARLLQEQPNRRLSIDRLERFGLDLIDTVGYLHAQGVDHRDIKPDNLGVHERAGDGEVHLKLFDFSLSRVSDRSLEAGTRGYLDPFLGQTGRHRWDDQAEWYAVSVTLFEMATGGHPVFGDGSDPQQVSDEATIAPGMFDVSVAEPITAFFRRALRRDARRRYPSIEAMRDAWTTALLGAGVPVQPGDSPQTDDPDALAAVATLDTPLDRSGLSNRALSAVERLDVSTVGELLAVPGGALTRLAGTNEATRRELRTRTKAWRERLGTPARPVQPDVLVQLRAVDLVVERLVPGSNGRNDNDIRAARLLLGQRASEGAGTDPQDTAATGGWLTQTKVADLLAIPRPTVTTIMRRLRENWRNDPTLREVRDDLVTLTDALGGAATARELADGLLAARGSGAPAGERLSEALGLVKTAVETELDHGGRARMARTQRESVGLVALEPPQDDPAGLTGQAVLNYAGSLGQAANALVAGMDTPTSLIRAAQELRRVAPPAGFSPLPDARLIRLAAHASTNAAVSSRDELYPVGLSAREALRHSSAAYGLTGAIRVDQLQERVKLRYPAAQPVPGRPDLGDLLAAIGSQLVWDSTTQAYRPGTAVVTTASSGRGSSILPGMLAVPEFAERDERLREALKTAGYLVVTVPRVELDGAADLLVARHGLRLVNLTAVLLQRMRALIEERGGPTWDQVLAADAAPPDSYDGRGLRALVAQAVAGLVDDVEAGEEPVLLTDVAPLARYGHLGMLERHADHTTRRRHALLVLLPEPVNSPVPMVDRLPAPLVAQGQWLRLPYGWIRQAAEREVTG